MFAQLIKHLPRLFSDHAPVLLTLTTFVSNKKKVFQFDNFWLEYIGCHYAVTEAWNFSPHSNTMNAFSRLISHARSIIISWKNWDLNSIETNINRLEKEILETEALETMNDTDSNSSIILYPLYNKLVALQRQNSFKWAQWARLMWVQSGDQNTSFFHNIICIRNHQNTISFITDSNGTCFTDHNDIEKVFCDFFTNLWTEPSDNSISDVFQALLYSLPSISPEDGGFWLRKFPKKKFFMLFSPFL